MDNSGIISDNAKEYSETADATLSSQNLIWPELWALSLSGFDREERRAFVGGSDANTILSGDRERILQLWREKRGEAPPEDLSGLLPVMLGLLDGSVQSAMV